MDTIPQFLSEYIPISVNSTKEFEQIFILNSREKRDIVAGYNQTKGKFL